MVTFAPGLGNGASPGGTCLVTFQIRVPNPTALQGKQIIAEPIRRICAEAWAKAVLAQFKPEIVDGALAPLEEAVVGAKSREDWERLKQAFDATDAWERLRTWIIRSVCSDLVMEFQAKVWPTLWESILEQFSRSEPSTERYEFEVCDRVMIYAQLRPQVITGGDVRLNIASPIAFSYSVKIDGLKPIPIALGED
ncbi:MAG: hypothetical protein KDD66_10175 [Bdellovibrionales bacterium]|nr:hypothetical protein [Bdellovibrionales bacterium]